MAKTARTYNDISKSLNASPPVRAVFSVLVFAVLLLPLVGMAWAPTEESVENRELASWPALFDEESGLNADMLSQMGDYFSDHFAYRVPMIDAGAHLYAGLFGVSTADTVVAGTDGWLYYAGTLNDYQNRAPLREGQLRNIAHNLRMLQDYCEEREAAFLFTVAPDKNSLYGEHMPFYYPGVASDDMDRLAAALAEAGVNYVDVRAALAASDERLYFLRDSHWTEKGALVAHDALAAAGGFATVGITEADLREVDDYTGDLAAMLYPLSPDPEPNWYAEGVNDGAGDAGTLRSGSKWRFTEGTSVEDSTVATEPAEGAFGETAAGNGGLLMFRDSFGNSLIPYLACEFSSATFSKKLPYNALLVESEQPSTVIVERAQRHVDLFAEQAPLMVCPSFDFPEDATLEEGEGTTTCESSENGPLACLQGAIDGIQLAADDEVVVRLTDEEGAALTYRAFLLSDEETGSDQGWCVYASRDLWADQAVIAEVIVQNEDHAHLLGTFDVAFEA